MLSFSLTLVLSLCADVPIQLVKLSFAPYPTAESLAGQTVQQTALEKYTHCWAQFSATDAAGKFASRVPQRDG